MRKVYIIAVLLLTLSEGGFCQEVLRLSEDASVARALEQNHGLKAARAQIKGAQAAYRAARAARLFRVQSQAGFLRLSPNIPDFRIVVPTPAGPREQVIAPAILDRYSMQLQVVQPLFTGGALKHQEQAARFQEDVVRAEFEASAVNLAYQVREAFWRLYEAEHVMRAKEHGVQRLKAQIKDVEHFREQGLAADQQVLAVKARLAQAQVEYLAATHAVEQARVALNRLLGLPLEQPVVLEADTVVGKQPKIEDVDAVVTARPEVKRLQAMLRSAEVQEGMARSAFFPQVYLMGTVDYARPNPYVFPPEDRFEATWNVGVRVSLPLWTWGQRVAEVDRAKSQVRMLREQLADFVEQIRMEVAQQRLRLEQTYAGVKATREAWEAAQEAFRVARVRYREGVALNSEVLEAEAVLREAEAAYHRAVAAFKRAKAGWKRTLGRVR